LLVAAIGFAAYRYPDWSRAHWLWLLAGTIAYKALVFILLPIAGFIGELWEKHFKDSALSACANWIKGYVGGSTRGLKALSRARHP
jgi:hypothetical protein